MAEKVLIIDDDPDITEAMRIVLESKGYEVSNATDGTEGMKVLKADKPDLVILDVMMNQMQEGFLVSRQLKADAQLKSIPILMITAVKEKTGLDFKEEAGDQAWLPVEDFLDKPVRPDQLLEKVQTLLAKRA
jgi:CheY-like chemotaxis protein